MHLVDVIMHKKEVTGDDNIVAEARGYSKLYKKGRLTRNESDHQIAKPEWIQA